MRCLELGSSQGCPTRSDGAADNLDLESGRAGADERASVHPGRCATEGGEVSSDRLPALHTQECRHSCMPGYSNLTDLVDLRDIARSGPCSKVADSVT